MGSGPGQANDTNEYGLQQQGLTEYLLILVHLFVTYEGSEYRAQGLEVRNRLHGIVQTESPLSSVM